jgi:hypothetical protein
VVVVHDGHGNPLDRVTVQGGGADDTRPHPGGPAGMRSDQQSPPDR